MIRKPDLRSHRLKPSRQRQLFLHDYGETSLPQLQAGRHQTFARYHLAEELDVVDAPNMTSMTQWTSCWIGRGRLRRSLKEGTRQWRTGALRSHEQLLQGEELQTGKLW